MFFLQIRLTNLTTQPTQERNEVSTMKYELYDVYETEILDTGELLCTSDDMAEIRAAAKERIADTDGECELYVKEWLGKKD